MNVNQQKAAIAAVELSDAMRQLIEAERGRFDTHIRDAWQHITLNEWADARKIVGRRIAKLMPGSADHKRWTTLGQLVDLAHRGSSAVAGGAIIEKEARQMVEELRARTRSALWGDEPDPVRHDEWRGPDGRLGYHSPHAWSESDYPGFGYRY